jgi:hypothetical protein
VSNEVDELYEEVEVLSRQLLELYDRQIERLIEINSLLIR